MTNTAFGGSGPANTGGAGGTPGTFPDAGPNAEKTIATGTAKLIDVFVGDAGVYVVSANLVVLVDRDGNERAHVVSAREITSVAFDGTQLVVADRAKLTSYTLDLATIASGDLLEWCQSSVLVSQDRFVCGPSNDWDRVFYTYDAKTAKLLASSKKYTYHGIPMRRVPGKDDFVTVTVDSSPSDFHLYSIGSDNQATYINESPYHGDFTVNNTYTFDGVPPSHLITSTGLMLRVYGVGCDPTTGSFNSTCFVKDGALGTLSGDQVFVASDVGAPGKIIGLVDASGFTFSGKCDKGCLLETIDVAQRTVLTQSIVRVSLNSVVALRHDPIANAAVIGYVVASKSIGFPGDPYPGYVVRVLPY